MTRPTDAIPRFHARRRLLFGMGALAGLAACGGGSGPHAAAVIDRQIGVAPGVSLYVRDWPAAPGVASGNVIVLLAGLGANAHAFDSLAPALARRHRVLAVTRRGYGASSKPLPGSDANDMTYAPATLVADLLAVLDALKVQRIILAGHSIAGNELTLFAGRHPQRVRGLVYLDTTFDYLASGGYEEPQPTPFDEPQPGPADLASLDASIAYARRINKQWWPALEANWRDALEVLPGCAVQANTPPAVARAMDMAAHNFSPDYRRVRAPALVVTVDPGTLRNLFPWLLQADPATRADAQALLDFIRPLRLADGDRLAAALPGSSHLVIRNGFHSDFFIEYESTVVGAIEAMRWEGLQ
ncbi:alpha/beta hydrolase [Janthinobacterium lividum]|uniref:Alpha/beta fold hydrolase n=1 Tax=Janthinobacterium lividum TaxID=29581 RepID=A0ABU0XMC9_9BURK|nr:alpha/beta fold hydrolase [Janthinobacterium lividum]MDQ4624358.1 alpha/beta fold hydrolase [Janthinobacterium lividum]MDQ4674038.1 alpha/beta fold hydrolase [Janthinobacterium lividum]MDQ4684768.1 alpha/beta fold hydrolase [Janthinobacterium lividum]